MNPLAFSAALLTLAASLHPNPAQAQTLPSRVAAGEVTPHSAVLWTRSQAAGVIRFRVALDPQFQQVVKQRLAFAFDPLRPVKVVVNGLQPGRTYYYEARNALGHSERGEFRTPGAPHLHNGVRFGVSGDSRGDLMPFRSVTNAPDRELDFFVMLGDTIYADIESPALPGVAQATTVAEFRAKHAEVNSAFNGLNGLGDLRASTVILATIDDHEVTNDFAGGAHPSTDPRFDQNGQFINQTLLYRAGLQAFVEYFPLLPTYYGFTGDARTQFRRKLYRKARYGLDAAVFVLDARSFRDQGLPAANPADPNSVASFLVGSFDPARTMLGRRQLDDLKADLLAAQAQGVVWKFVMVPEPIQNLGVVAASDRFEGYAAERTELLAHVAANGIENVVFVAADIHGTLVNNLSYQLAPGAPQLPTTAWEITTGAVAFDAPFGPTVVDLAFQLGLISQADKAFYDAAPVAVKDVFVRGLVNAQVVPLGYDPVGLEGSNVPATLVQGGYVATHVWGWTEFEVDAATHELTVTTYGVAPFDSNATPTIASQFRVAAQ